jgi:isopenicillin N synthase-like dioxygenase
VSLDQPPDFFADWLVDSLSTLRLLHYPPVSPEKVLDDDAASVSSVVSSHSTLSTSDASSTHDSIFSATSSSLTGSKQKDNVKLSCTPHTDSGILTLLHQDPTGGLEVLNSTGDWIPAPYIPHTIVVNIGDLMAKVSGGRWVATMHRVRAPMSKGERVVDGELGMGRFSVPFFFEPGEECLVRDLEGGDAVRYGQHVREKMKGFVEFQDEDDDVKIGS